MSLVDDIVIFTLETNFMPVISINNLTLPPSLWVGHGLISSRAAKNTDCSAPNRFKTPGLWKLCFLPVKFLIIYARRNIFLKMPCKERRKRINNRKLHKDDQMLKVDHIF